MAAAKTILILESNPWQDLSLNQEIRDLTGVIERARNADAFKIEQGLAVRTEDLQELMLRYEPQIVHFCGHGSGEEGLVLQDAAKQPVAVATEALSRLFGLCKEHVDCVVLNACYSEVQAAAIVEHVDFAIGMQQTIRDDAAQHFAQGFYRALGYGKPVEVAYEWGCNAIQLMLASGAEARTRDSAVPQRRKISRTAEGGVPELPEYLKPRLFKRAGLGAVEVAAVAQPSGAELAELGQALEQEDALEQYREKVREFLEDRKLSALEKIRLERLRKDLDLAEPDANQVVEEEMELILRTRDEYEAMLLGLIELGHYPFDEETREELDVAWRELGLLEIEVEEIAGPILAAAEEDLQAHQREEQRRNQQKKQEQEKQQARERKPPRPVGESSGTVPGRQSFEFETVTLKVTTESTGFLGLGSKVNLSQQRKLGKAEYFVEALGQGVALEMVYIPGGEFWMGAADGEEEADDDECPRHRVRVPEFCLGKFAVTQAQYRLVMGENPAKFKGDQRPVERVSWEDAQAFCQKLSEKVGREYRLPSEAEWEYACRAGTTTPFHFGETISTDLGNYDGNYTYGKGSKGQYREQTIDVGSFPPNAFGLYDMHGNVWEWCADLWHSNYDGAPVDGSAWATASDEGELYVLLRGGSWALDPRYCRSASRICNAPDYRNYGIGFRLCCVAPRAV